MVHIAVAGAGIAGLATSLALARAGIDVSLIERRPAFAEVGAGLQLSPNATRILEQWGLLPELRAKAVEPGAIVIRRGATAQEITRVDLLSEPALGFGAPFLLLHRADIQRVLADAVQKLPVKLSLGSAVTAVDVMHDRVSVQAGNRSCDADGVVDAGGFRTALAENTMREKQSRRVAWRALIPADRCAAFAREASSNLWLGPKAHLVHYPLRRATLVNVVAVVDAPKRPLRSDSDLWSTPGETKDLLPAFAGWHCQALDLLRAAPAWNVWPLVDGSPIAPAWSVGRRTRVGDAAHPMLPFLAQGASQAIEDAAALCESLGGTPDDVPQAFRAYEQRRRQRALAVQAASRRQGGIYHLSGPASLARDLTLRLLGPRGMMNRMAWLYGS